MTVTVNLSAELAERLTAEAARRGVKAEDLAAEFIAEQLPGKGSDDPLETFIGSGHSGRGDLARRHREIRTESTEAFQLLP